MRRIYLTTPIYYVNAEPHLGHTYTTVIADAVARYHRSRGTETFFVTGTDEHGDKIAEAAAAAGETPKAYADRIAALFRSTWDACGIRYDHFIRTTDEHHQRFVQEVLTRIHASGDIYFGEYEGLYCTGCERFYMEKELVGGKCPDHKTEPKLVKEENYFFRMSRYQERLLAHVHANPDWIRPERYRNEILGFLREPLQDLSISRPKSRLTWGIPLPFDDTYVTYVWFDALINYVSALGGPGAPRFERYWPHAQHVIAKDIVKPHAIYWPCMLKAAGIDLYRHLNVHGYWTLGGRKISKSVGNLVEALALKDKYGNDAFRYFVLREMVFGLDADFSEEALVSRLNADLANDLGNLVARVTTLIANVGGGSVPATEGRFARGGEAAFGGDLKGDFEKSRGNVDAAMEEFAFHRALAAIWDFIGAVNRYVDTTQPWARPSNDMARGQRDHALYHLGQSLWCLGLVLEPFLPEAARKIRHALGHTGDPKLGDAEWGRLAPGTRVQKLSGLFPRIEAKDQSDLTYGATRTSRTPSAGQSGRAVLATIDDFSKVDLRVAEVLTAEPVPKSKKLLKLTVSLGSEQRTLVAGIAEHYAPADLVGKKVVVVANLEPAQLMGIESNGMVLAGSTEGKLAVLTLDRDLPPGTKIT